jgi:hypothetical protein
MLIRISLILAIIAALGAGAVNFFVVKDKLATLITDRDTQKSDKEKAQTDLASTKRTLAQTQSQLSQTQQDLADANSKLATETATAAAETRRADGLSSRLDQTTQERDDAQNNLAAYKATGLSPEQIGKISRDNKDLKEAIAAANDEAILLNRKISSLSNELAKYVGPDDPVKLPADLKGKIVVVDPKWDFVVLDIGGNQGVLDRGELLVSRAGKLVAKVKVFKIDKDNCRANIIPGWKLGEVFEGDEVTPAYPAS